MNIIGYYDPFDFTNVVNGRFFVVNGIFKTKVAILSDSHDNYDNIVLDICIDLRFRRFLVVSMPQSGIRMKPDQQFSYMRTILV